MKWEFSVEASKVITESVGRYNSGSIKVTLEDVNSRDLIEAVGGTNEVLENIDEDILLEYVRDNFDITNIVFIIGEEELLNEIGSVKAIAHFGITEQKE
jgi:hypothetical protein